MAAPRGFEETIYRLVEGSGGREDAAALKSRLDREPEFRSAFDRTRRTVVALQGLGPKPEAPRDATFTQRDFDKLSRDIVKGYKGKLAELHYQLGLACLADLPPGRYALRLAVPPPPREVSEGKLGKAQESLRAVVGADRGLLSEDDRMRIFGGASDSRPANDFGLAVSSFRTSRALRPRFSPAWSREARVWLSQGETSRAFPLLAQAGELAEDSAEKNVLVCTRSMALYLEGRNEENFVLLRDFVESFPVFFEPRFNLATAMWNLRNFPEAARELGKVFSLASASSDLRRVCEKGVRTGDWAEWREGDPRSFESVVKFSRSYLGEDVARFIEVAS